MLIVNADDYGKTRRVTDRTLLCYKTGRITSATAMMFMTDTERAADLALQSGMDTGLHLNISDRFTGNHHNFRLDQCQERVSGFLNSSRFSVLLYNPFLKRDFEYTFRSQWERFVELYKRPPSHVDGHRHKHLCYNALFGGLIPRGIKVRRNFHFGTGEKWLLNRIYRSLIDRYLTRRYVCADYFFSIRPLEDRERIRRIGDLARKADVELMVHPDVDAELLFLMSDEYARMLTGVIRGSYSRLRPRAA